MDAVVGLGNAGCNIVDEFAKYPQYKTYKIDVGLEKAKTSFPLQEQKKIEDYETRLPNLKYFFRGLRGEVLFIVGGGGKVSSASLAVLKNLKNKCKISVLYVKPSLGLLSETQSLLERMVFGVFQEYARSGVFERLYVTSNEEIEYMLGGISIKNYYNKINETIVSTLHMINVYKNNKSITNTYGDLPLGARITTIGMYNKEENEDKMFFSLDNVSDVVYYYAYSKNRLETDSSLMADIKKNIERNKFENIRATYGIYETDYEQDYVYCLHHTSEIQR
jgi:hypothetical protein